MEPAQILAELEQYRGPFPYEAVRRAIEERERIAPLLLRVLEDAIAEPKALLHKPDYMAHVFAMFLLSQFREKRAYPLLVQFFSLPGELSLDLTGDVVTEDLERMLASVSCGDTTLIKELIENPHVNEYVASAAVRSLVALVAAEEQTRESVVEYFRSLFRGKLRREPSHVWESLVWCSIDLYPEELRADIAACFGAGLVNEFFVSPDQVEEALADGPETTLSRLTDDPWYRLIEDTTKEMEWWACFQPEYGSAKTKKRKIGRNEPCPCGSGRKYKKCCGRPE